MAVMTIAQGAIAFAPELRASLYLVHGRYRKGIYVDGHERDVVVYH